MGTAAVVLVLALVVLIVVLSARRSARSRADAYTRRTGAPPRPYTSLETLDEPTAARRLAQLVEPYPTHTVDILDRKHLLWDKGYIDAHPMEPRFRERFEVREIGREFHRRGGSPAMHSVADLAVDVSLEDRGPVPWVKRHLDELWNDIGDWRATR